MTYVKEGEDEELVRKNAHLFTPEIRYVSDPFYELDREERIRQEQEEDRKRREDYKKKLEEIQQLEFAREERELDIISEGRHKLITKPNQVIFQEGVCSDCEAPVMFVADGWNRNRLTAGFNDLTIPYDKSYIDERTNNYTKRHYCQVDSPAESCKILTRRIDKLAKEFSDYKEFVRSTYRPWSQI